MYAHRRQDLHNLKLSEELLPLTSLNSILTSAATYDSVPLPDLNWYYTHKSVRPLWATPDFLVFEVNLPLVRPSSFLLYTIQGWPVPSGPSLSIQILDSGNYGYDTDTGHLFKATRCSGLSPQVCSWGPLFKLSFPPCIQGILKGNHGLIQQCTVQVHSGNSSRLSYFSENKYILATWGEVLEARCYGHNARSVSLERGLYHIQLPRACSLSSKAWTISAISIKHFSLHITPKLLNRPHPLNFSAILDSSSLALPILHPLHTM